MQAHEWLGLFWKDLFKKMLIKDLNRIEMLKSTTFFSDFSDLQIGLTSEFLHERKYASDAFIFEIGHPGAALYFIETGSVSIEIPDESGKTVQLAVLQPGSFFGELALIDDSPRSASARAQGETKILALPRSELQRMLVESPVLGGLVYRALAQINGSRLKATIEKMQKTGKPTKLVANG